ncbi:MAG: hypothetical protein FJ279_07310, partial [Planctomycetes bacterium]|nr:hypothetical protein [Planctomycetota bacterium]
MRVPPGLARARSAVSFHLLSVPIFVKVIGIGALVAALFGGVTLVLTRASMSGILYQLLEERALSTAHSLSTHLRGPMST